MQIPEQATIETLAANWINGNRKDVIDALELHPPAVTAYLTMHLVIALQDAAGHAFGDVAMLSTMLEQRIWRLEEVR